MSSVIVIKVKYGDTLRRFTVYANIHYFCMVDLRKKILDSFKFTSDTDFTVTYIDEDNDVVTLLDNNDLQDAFIQGHNPLRLNVLLNSTRVGTSDSRSTEISIPLRSPHMNSGVAEVLGDLPEPVRDALTKLSSDLASNVASLVAELSKLCIDLVSKAASSAPALAEVVEVSNEDNTAP